MDIRWLVDPDLEIESIPEEARIALINYDRLVRLRGFVSMPDEQVVYTHGPDHMRLDWTADAVVFDPSTDVDDKPVTVSLDDLCKPWPGVPY